MIGKRDLERVIGRALLDRARDDADALERLGYDPAGVEELGYRYADTAGASSIARRDAIAAAFAAGLELGVRCERERRGA